MNNMLQPTGKEDVESFDGDDISIKTEDIATFQIIKVPAKVHECTHNCLERYKQSALAKNLYIFSMVILVIYVLFLGGLHVSYIIYFASKGAMISFTSMPAWLLPAGIAVFYMSVVFKPIFNLYTQIKEKLFEICNEEEEARVLLVKEKYDEFLPRLLVEKFYIKNAKQELFKCLMKILTATGMMIVMFVAMYPTEVAKSGSSSSSMMTSLILVLPFMAKDLSNMKIPDDQMKELEEKMKVHIKAWLKACDKIAQKGRGCSYN